MINPCKFFICNNACIARHLVLNQLALEAFGGFVQAVVPCKPRPCTPVSALRTRAAPFMASWPETQAPLAPLTEVLGQCGILNLEIKKINDGKL